MFNRILLTLLNQKEAYTNLKKIIAQTSLEKPINYIIDYIDREINKIIELNQIKLI